MTIIWSYFKKIGKDQRTPATGYISYPTLSASKRIISCPWVHRNVLFHIKGGMKKYCWANRFAMIVNTPVDVIRGQRTYIAQP